MSDDEEEAEAKEEKEGEVEEVKPEDEAKEKKVGRTGCFLRGGLVCCLRPACSPNAEAALESLVGRLLGKTPTPAGPQPPILLLLPSSNPPSPPSPNRRPQKKKVKEVSHEWQLVNKQKPIWMRK